jgi:hypothetical protein
MELLAFISLTVIVATAFCLGVFVIAMEATFGGGQ